MADDLNLDRIRRDVKDVSGRRVVTDHILPTLSRLIVEDVPAMADELERLRKEVKHEKAVTRLAEQHARNADASGAEAAAAQARSEARYAELNAMHLREVAELNTVLEAHRQRVEQVEAAIRALDQPAEGAPESEDLVKLHGQVAEALLRWHSERVVICEHTQIVSYGEAADAVVAVPMIKGLVSHLKLSQFHRGTAEAEGKRLREANKALADMMERVPEIHMRFGVLLPDGTVQPATACADWCWLCRVEQAEAERDALNVQVAVLQQALADRGDDVRAFQRACGTHLPEQAGKERAEAAKRLEYAQGRLRDADTVNRGLRRALETVEAELKRLRQQIVDDEVDLDDVMASLHQPADTTEETTDAG